MSPNSPTPPVPPPPATTPPPKKHRWLLFGCGGLLAVLLVIIAAVAITFWWIQRPIKPVVLSPKEKAVAEQKLRVLEDTNVPPGTISQRPAPPPQSTYVPGQKVIRLTQREVNGLLNANTDLGNAVRLEFDKDAINAYLAVPIPQDFPVLGGKMFRARGRFLVSLGNGGKPYAILQDITVFGLSLPKAWLGGLKGENLLGDALGQKNGSPLLRGIKSLRVEPGALVLEVED